MFDPMRRHHLFQAIIFDMDGVIVDSEPLHIKAERQTLAPFDLDISDAEFHAYMGQTPKKLLEGIIAKYALPTTLEAIYPIHAANLLRLYRNEVTPIPGAIELIAQLAQTGLPLGIASSSDLELIHAVIDKFHLGSAIGAVASGQEMTRIKPHPDIYLTVAERLGVDPARCCAIEDSTAGVRSAKAAGMACIGFQSPNSPGQRHDLADRVVDDLRTLCLDAFASLWARHRTAVPA